MRNCFDQPNTYCSSHSLGNTSVTSRVPLSGLEPGVAYPTSSRDRTTRLGVTSAEVSEARGRGGAWE